MTLTDLDRAALERAITVYRTTFPSLRPNIDRELAEGADREAIGRYCASYLQVWNLHLGPWQVPPCRAHPEAEAKDDNRLGEVDAARLHRRMIEAGLSKYECDPAEALSRAAR